MKVMNYTKAMLKIPSPALIRSALSTLKGSERSAALDEVAEQNEKILDFTRLNRELSEQLMRQQAAFSYYTKSLEVAGTGSPWGRIQDALGVCSQHVLRGTNHRLPSTLASGAVQIFYAGDVDMASWPLPALAFDEAHEAHGAFEHPYIPQRSRSSPRLKRKFKNLNNKWRYWPA